MMIILVLLNVLKMALKFVMLFKTNNNEYPLLNYMMNRGTYLKKITSKNK